MNIRKPTNQSALFTALDTLMVAAASAIMDTRKEQDLEKRINILDAVDRGILW